jgi:hypothetical protein
MNKLQSKNSMLPAIFYAAFILLFVGSLIFVPKNIVLNNMDLIAFDSYYIVFPIAVIISLVFLNWVYVSKEYVEMPLWGKGLVHVFSVLIMSFGIFGSIMILNQVLSDGQDYDLKGTVEEKYIKKPGRVDYKTTYRNARFFVLIKEEGTNKSYRFQVSEEVYEDVEEKMMMDRQSKIMQKAFKQLNNPTNPAQEDKEDKEEKETITLRLKKGALGILY